MYRFLQAMQEMATDMFSASQDLGDSLAKNVIETVCFNHLAKAYLMQTEATKGCINAR
jgi:hypothetical protein